jgi:5'(3')-deoxyribonucleotidase
MKKAIADFVKGHDSISIALDVDQVLANPFALVIKELHKTYGIHYTPKDLKEYPTPGKPFLNVTNEEFNRMYNDVWNAHWKDIPRLANNEILVRLSKTFKVDIVSSRGEEAAAPLHKWLNLYYPEMKTHIVVTKKYSDKTALPYNIYIDDAPRLASSIEQMEGKLLLLIDAPYNKGIKNSSKTVRFPDVDSACTELLKVR